MAQDQRARQANPGRVAAHVALGKQGKWWGRGQAIGGVAERGVAADLAGPGTGEVGAQPGRFRRGRTCCGTPPQARPRGSDL